MGTLSPPFRAAPAPRQEAHGERRRQTLGAQAALSLALVAASVLAGCSGHPKADLVPPRVGPALEGFVLDEAVRPIAGANLTVQGVGVTLRQAVTSGADGHYAFQDLPAGRTLVVLAQAKGRIDRQAQVSVSATNTTRLDLTLDPVPVRKPFSVGTGFNGFLSCEVAAAGAGQNATEDCGGPTSMRDWSFDVYADVQGIVLETAWTPVVPTSQRLHIDVQTAGAGGRLVRLAAATGPSLLRVEVPQALCRSLLPLGGTLQVRWGVDPEAAQQPGGAGAATWFQQPFHAVATAFYVDPPPPGYTSA